MMNNLNKSQVLVLSLLLLLLSAAPLLSSSLRPTYLYFIFNLLIISLGAEAGLLSSFPRPPQNHDKKHNSHPVCVAIQPEPTFTSPKNTDRAPSGDLLAPEKIGTVEIKLKECISKPSLFFIGNGGDQFDEEEREIDDQGKELEEEDGSEDEESSNTGISGQELFAKAETFIANFYKQLRMQREDSWKRLHGFSQKACHNSIGTQHS